MAEQMEMNQTQPPPSLVNNILFYYEGENTLGIRARENKHFLQHKGKHSNNKETYTDGSKSTGNKVGYAAVFKYTTKNGALPEETSIHTAALIVPVSCLC